MPAEFYTQQIFILTVWYWVAGDSEQITHTTVLKKPSTACD